MRFSTILLAVSVSAFALVNPTLGQFTALTGCSVTSPTPSYDEVPIETCIQNLDTTIPNSVACAAPCSGTCSSCAHFEWQSGVLTVPYCVPLSPPWELQLGASRVNATLRCMPMKIAPTLADTFTSFTVASTVYTPSTFEASLLNGARGLTMNDFVCGFRDPTKQILSSSDPGMDDFDGATNIDAVSVLTTGDADLGFSFQQVVLCLEETGAPTQAPTPQPTNSPVSPASTLTMSLASLTLMLGFTLL